VKCKYIGHCIFPTAPLGTEGDLGGISPEYLTAVENRIKQWAPTQLDTRIQAADSHGNQTRSGLPQPKECVSCTEHTDCKGIFSYCIQQAGCPGLTCFSSVANEKGTLSK